jgi:CSLREA domain-containing protein
VRRLAGLVATSLVALAVQVGISQPAGASGSLVVTTTDDGADGECVEDCTLREAFQVINAAGPGSWEVRLPAGTYRLLDQSSGPEFADALRVPSMSSVAVVGEDATIDLEGWNGGVTSNLEHPSASVQRLFQLGDEHDLFSAHLYLTGLSITNLGDAPVLSRETTRTWLVYGVDPSPSASYAYSGVGLDHLDVAGSGDPDALTSGIATVSTPKSTITISDSRISHLGYGSRVLPESTFGAATVSASRVYIVRSSFDHAYYFDGREILNVGNSEIMDPIAVFRNWKTGQNVAGPGLVAFASASRQVSVVQNVVGFRSFTIDNIPCVPFYPFDCFKAAMPMLFVVADVDGSGGIPGSLRIDDSTVINPLTGLVFDEASAVTTNIRNVTVTTAGQSGAALNWLITDRGASTVNVSHLTSSGRNGPLLTGPVRIGSSILDVPTTAGPVCSGLQGTPISLGYNVISDSSCVAHGTDVVGVSNPLEPLGGYGGPTPTRPPVVGSVAVNLIPAASCTIAADQRGISRPQGPRCDAGAVELEARRTTEGEQYPGPGGGLG